MIAHMWRFDREIIWLRNVIMSGKLGKIFKAKSHEVLIYGGRCSISRFRESVNPSKKQS